MKELAGARVSRGRGSESEALDDGSAHNRRDGNFNGPDAWVPHSVVGGVQGFRAQRRWRAACDVCVTVKHIRRQSAASTSPDQWLRAQAADILRKPGPTGQDGALGQLRGHLFELLDIRDYNLRRQGGYRLVQLRKSFNRFYDASRFDANGKYAGPVQHKLGPSGITGAVKKLEAHKRGLTKKVTFRVPADRFDACARAAQGRTRVNASRLTTKAVARVEDDGLRDLAAHGEAATSPCRQSGRAAARSAAVSMVVGGLVDLHALAGGDLNASQFAARRGVDATQAGITAVGTAAAVSGVTSGAAFLASKAVPGTLAFRAMGAVAASPVVAPAVAAVVVAYGVSRAASPVRRYVTGRLARTRSASVATAAPPAVNS